jgi:hypothetical protein
MNPPQIDLMTLDAKHPKLTLFADYGPRAIYRLSQSLSNGDARTRSMELSLKPKDESIQSHYPTLSWEALPTEFMKRVRACPRNFNEGDITEGAAIVVVAGLVAEYLKAEVTSVLKIGTGSDYEMKFEDAKFNLECSGLNNPGTKYRHTERLKDKTDQLLCTIVDFGFVGVVTFGHHNEHGLHAFLHFVSKKDKK